MASAFTMREGSATVAEEPWQLPLRFLDHVPAQRILPGIVTTPAFEVRRTASVMTPSANARSFGVDVRLGRMWLVYTEGVQLVQGVRPSWIFQSS